MKSSVVFVVEAIKFGFYIRGSYYREIILYYKFIHEINKYNYILQITSWNTCLYSFYPGSYVHKLGSDV